MNRDDVLSLAQEVGIMMRSHEYQDEPTKLERFAALVAAHVKASDGAIINDGTKFDVQPVAWIKKDRSSIEVSIMSSEYMLNLGFEPLYTHPPAAAVQDLVASLMIIAGKQRCVDSLMSNVDIALEALKSWEGK